VSWSTIFYRGAEISPESVEFDQEKRVQAGIDPKQVVRRVSGFDEFGG
jgi:hypothetical protein